MNSMTKIPKSSVLTQAEQKFQTARINMTLANKTLRQAEQNLRQELKAEIKWLNQLQVDMKHPAGTVYPWYYIYEGMFRRMFKPILKKCWRIGGTSVQYDTRKSANKNAKILLTDLKKEDAIREAQKKARAAERVKKNALLRQLTKLPKDQQHLVRWFLKSKCA